MKMLRALMVLSAASLIVLAGCGGGDAYDSEPAAAEAPAAEAQAAQPAVATNEGEGDSHGEHAHNVKCGCAIEGVGECGNYVEVEGQYVELVLPTDLDLGKMPFCGKDELTAQVTGEMQDDKFVATAFSVN